MNKIQDAKTKMLGNTNNDVSDDDYNSGVFMSCMIIVSKLFILGLVRFMFYAFKGYDQKATVFSNPAVSILLVISLLLVHFIFCMTHSGSSSPIKWVFNIILLAIETLIVLNCEFNVIVMTMLGDIMVFHIVTALMVRLRGGYHFKMSIFFILFLFVVSVGVLAVTCEKYFEDTSFSYFKLNALIGGLVYCIWASLFFNVKTNIEFMKAENYSFAISNDLFYIMAEILQEIKVEFTLQDVETKEDQQTK